MMEKTEEEQVGGRQTKEHVAQEETKGGKHSAAVHDNQGPRADVLGTRRRQS